MLPRGRFSTERAPTSGAVAVWGDCVYVAGGWAGVWSQRDDVWVADLREDGTLGAWRTAGRDLLAVIDAACRQTAKMKRA